MTDAKKDISRRLHRLERTVRGLSGGTQLAFSSIEDGSIDTYDRDSAVIRQRIGKQADGRITTTDHNGPEPPAPSSPRVEQSQMGLGVTWDGEFGSHVERRNLAPHPKLDSTKGMATGGKAESSTSRYGISVIPAGKASSAVYVASVHGDSHRSPSVRFLPGRTYTVSVDRRVREEQEHQDHDYAGRGISIDLQDAAGASIDYGWHATDSPNEVGTERVHVTFTLPAYFYDVYVRLVNGSTDEDEPVDFQNLLIEESDEVLPYFDGDTLPDDADENKVQVRWAGSSGGAAQLVTVAGEDKPSDFHHVEVHAWDKSNRRVNLAPHPRLDTTDDAVTGGSGTEIEVDDTWSKIGDHSIKVSPDGSTASAVYPIGNTTEPLDLGWKPGQTYTVSAWIHLEEGQTGDLHSYAARCITAGVRDGDDNLNQSFAVSDQPPNEAGTHRVNLIFTTPQDSDKVLFIRLMNGSTETPVWWGGLLIEEGSTLRDYFDGDTMPGGDPAEILATNLAQNPSFHSLRMQDDPDDELVTNGDGEISIDDGWSFVGDRSLKHDGGDGHSAAYVVRTENDWLRPGRTYMASIVFHQEDAQEGVDEGDREDATRTLQWAITDNDGTNYDDDHTSPQPPNEAGTYCIVDTFEVSDDANSGFIRLRNYSTSTCWWDGLLVQDITDDEPNTGVWRLNDDGEWEPADDDTDGEPPSYFDGDTPSNNSVYRWKGEPHESESIKMSHHDSGDDRSTVSWLKGPDVADGPSEYVGTLQPDRQSLWATMTASGTVTLAPMLPTEHTVALRAVTSSNTAGDMSDYTMATPRTITADDLANGSIGRDALAEDAITSDMLVGKKITGGEITGAKFQTAEDGSRWEMGTGDDANYLYGHIGENWADEPSRIVSAETGDEGAALNVYSPKVDGNEAKFYMSADSDGSGIDFEADQMQFGGKDRFAMGTEHASIDIDSDSIDARAKEFNVDVDGAALNLDRSDSEVKIAGDRIRMQSLGGEQADFTVGSSVQSKAVANRENSSGANVYITGSGNFRKSSSTRRVKTDEKAWDDPPLDSIKQLEPRLYRDKESVENYDKLMEKTEYPTVDEWFEADVDDIHYQVGLIAEDVDKLDGLDMLVGYRDPNNDKKGTNRAATKKQGDPDSVRYDRLAVALLPWLHQIDDRLDKLEGDDG